MQSAVTHTRVSDFPPSDSEVTSPPFPVVQAVPIDGVRFAEPAPSLPSQQPGVKRTPVLREMRRPYVVSRLLLSHCVRAIEPSPQPSRPSLEATTRPAPWRSGLLRRRRIRVSCIVFVLLLFFIFYVRSLPVFFFFVFFAPYVVSQLFLLQKRTPCGHDLNTGLYVTTVDCMRVSSKALAFTEYFNERLKL